jgi:predicted peptidase
MSLTRYFALLASVASLVAADKPAKPAVAPAENAVPRTALKTQVAPGASLKFDFPELTVDRKGALAACYLILPANYDPAKKYPLIAWLAGGEGGNQPNKSFLPSGDFVLVGLPYPKGANNPAQANMVGDYAKVWAYQRFMLEEIAKVIPNLDRSRSIIAGFSNGGHAIDGMLRMSGKPKLSDYFGIFVLADGGGTAYSSKGNLPDLKGKFAYVCWGSEKGSNKPNTSQLPKALKAKGATVADVEMTNVGHAFPEPQQAKAAQWIERIALEPADAPAQK